MENDGDVEIVGFSDGSALGFKDKLGDKLGTKVGAFVTLGFCEGRRLGALDAVGLSEGI